MTDNEMLRNYDRFSAAHVYALGFVHEHSLFVAKLSLDELSAYCKHDRASSKKGGFAKLRIRMSSDDCAELSAKAERLGADDLLTADKDHNKGENLERVLTERWTGQRWVKNSVPFWVAGDIKVDGVEIQVKLDRGELTNEKVLGMLMER